MIDDATRAASDAAPADEPDDLLPHGERLAGRYELTALLGRGGMGTVYRVKDCELDEVVALKTLHRGVMGSEEALARFRREVKLARRITHSNVARTFDIGEHRGAKFLTMEFVAGDSLAARIASKGIVPAEEAVRIAKGIAEGLAAAHAVGVVHRDLKPENVLLSGARVVVTDFGIARALEESGSTRVTRGGVLGTPAYMAPEQVEGGEVDARADIYALGEILFEMLTGSPPWAGSSAIATAVARLTKPPPDPRGSARVDDALAEIVLRAMARSPGARFQTAADLGAALDSCQGSPTLAARGAVVTGQSHSLTFDATTRIPSSSLSSSPGILPEGRAKSVLVVPPSTQDRSDEALAMAVCEELIDALCTVASLRVVPLGAALEGLARGKNPLEVAAMMGAAVAVTGSLRREGDDVVLSTRLLSVDDGFQIGASRARKAKTELGALANELANKLAEGLEVRFRSRPQPPPLPASVLDLYWEARALYNRPGAGTPRALELITKALALAPDQPELLAMLAMTHVRKFAFNPDADASLEVAREATLRARALAPDLAEPHVASATILVATGRPAEAVVELHAALRQNSRLAEAHDLLGMLRFAAGDTVRGIASMRTAIALDPRMAPFRFQLALAYELSGEHEKADEILATPPQPDSARAYWIAMARIVGFRRDTTRARELLPLAPPSPGRWILELIATGTFSTDLRRGFEKQPLGGACLERTDRFARLKAEGDAYLCDWDSVRDLLAMADGAGCFDITWFRNTPTLAPLRHDPQFQLIEGRVAARAAEVLAADAR